MGEFFFINRNEFCTAYNYFPSLYLVINPALWDGVVVYDKETIAAR